MIYIKVIWKQDRKDFPCLIYGELLEDRNESRKVEVYYDGSYGYASDDIEVGKTAISECPWPSLEEIEKDSEFLPTIIEKNEFEEVWQKAVLFNKNQK